MPGPMRKPRGQRLGARPAVKPVLDIVQGRGGRIPAAPPELGVRGREDWRRWWGSRIGKLADPEVDLPTVRRLFALREERDQVAALLKRVPGTARGSKKQPVLSPHVRRQAMLDAEIRHLEQALERRLLERSQFGDPLPGDGGEEDLNGYYGDGDSQ